VTGGGTATLTINPSSNLILGASYYVQIDANALKDPANNDYAGITDKTTWNFTATSDGTPPAVSALSPDDDATAVAKSANILITFDEPVNKGTGNIVIKRTVDDSVFETIAVDSGQVTGEGTAAITVNPSTDFESETGYYVIIDAGAFEDAVTNPFAGISDKTTWNFTVVDYIPPSVNTLSPATTQRPWENPRTSRSLLMKS